MRQNNNNKTNRFIQILVIIADFCLLNIVVAVSTSISTFSRLWSDGDMITFYICCNLAMAMAEAKLLPIVQRRMISAGEILKRIILLITLQTILSYLMLKAVNYHMTVGRLLLSTGSLLIILLVITRLIERLLIKRFRSMGRNTRMVTFVGSDRALVGLYERLISDPTAGYRLLGYYADREMQDTPTEFKRLGSIAELMQELKDGATDIGDELYLCVPRREKALIRQLSKHCERRMRRFFFVPVTEEKQDVGLKLESINDLEIYTSIESPLLFPVNKAIKRLFDILFSLIALLIFTPLFPLVALIIRIQSPGPILFRQERTGLDGRTFTMLKFRSMHINDESDSLQATKDDPRKYPFGSWMRRTNIDEFPQFWNVLKGDMSIVGPRPHMLAHTEFYSEQIDKYMVRHFVKPGITGWAQVTGFRGETKELWQMEGRVIRDIWYMEHWSIWLDVRIVWLTIKSMFFSDDSEAY